MTAHRQKAYKVKLPVPRYGDNEHMSKYRTVVCPQCRERWSIYSGKGTWRCDDCGLDHPVDAPPTILCSRCGEPLDKMVGLYPPSSFYRCLPCGRSLP